MFFMIGPNSHWFKIIRTGNLLPTTISALAFIALSISPSDVANPPCTTEFHCDVSTFGIISELWCDA